METTKFTAWLFTFFTLAGVIAYLLVPRHPQADFDVIGILYIMQNILPLTILAATFFCGATAFGLWVKYWSIRSKENFR